MTENSGGKLRPEPKGLRLENIISAVPPMSIPQADPKVSPEIKIVTVINSMFGISNKENPTPMARAAKIAARTRLFSFIIAFV